MSFLDNLENNLKSLESRDERDPTDARRRESDRTMAKAVAPWAERLKSGEFSKALMQQATRAGFQIRTKVHMVWIGATLRLEARNLRLELRPSRDGVDAVILRDREELRRGKVDLNGSPESLVREFIPLVEERKREEEAEQRRMEEDRQRMEEEDQRALLAEDGEGAL